MRGVRLIIAIVAEMRDVLTQVYLLAAVVLLRRPQRLVQVQKVVMGIMFGTIPICWLSITHRVVGRVLKLGGNPITTITEKEKGVLRVRVLL